MAGEAGSIEHIAIEIGRALGTLAEQFEKPAVVFEGLGLRPPEGFVDQLGNPNRCGDRRGRGSPGPRHDADGCDRSKQPGPGAIAAAGKALVDGIRLTVQKMRRPAAALGSVGGSFPGLTAEEQAQVATFAQEFLERLLGALVADVLSQTFPRVFGVAQLIGVVEDVADVPGVNDAVTSDAERETLRFDRLALLFTDPAQYLEQTYGWGTTNFKAELLLSNLQRFLDEQVTVPSTLITAPGQPPVLEAFLFNVAEDNQASPSGLRVDLRIKSEEDFVSSGSLTENWDLNFTVGARFEQDVSVGIPAAVGLGVRAFRRNDRQPGSLPRHRSIGGRRSVAPHWPDRRVTTGSRSPQSEVPREGPVEHERRGVGRAGLVGGSRPGSDLHQRRSERRLSQQDSRRARPRGPFRSRVRLVTERGPEGSRRGTAGNHAADIHLHRPGTIECDPPRRGPRSQRIHHRDICHR